MDNMKSNWDSVKGRVDWPVFSISGGLLTLFVIVSLINVEAVSEFVNKGFGISIKYFGAYWQLLLLATFIVGLGLSFSKYGSVKLGNIAKPDMSMFKWSSIIIVSGLGAGGVFWAAAEPIYYFTDVPPIYPGIESGTVDAIMPALAQSFMDWGFTAWAVYGAISAVVIMYAHYHKGMPLKPRTLLYPILGDKILTSKWGTLADSFCIIGAAAGTIGTIGFFGLQVSYSANQIIGLPDNPVTQVSMIIGLIIVTIISTITGIDKGIQWLSKVNVIMAIVVGFFILLFGPGAFIIDSFISSFGFYLTEFVNISTYRGDQEWISWWMLFFFGWFIGFGPMIAILVARISRGRTVREIFLVVSVVAALTSNFWFTILGGTGIFYELNQAGSVSGPLLENGLPAAIIATAQQMPLSSIMPLVFLILTILFVITTADSMSYTLAMGVTGEGDPPTSVRVFWAVLMGIISIILINLGSGGIGGLQSFVVIAAVPVSILLLPSLWDAPRIAKKLAIEQGIVKTESEEVDKKKVG
jgi:glycine betaine transporter